MWGSVQAGGGGGGLKYEDTMQSATADTEYTINCGFEPKQIYISSYTSSTAFMIVYYDADVSTSNYLATGAISATSKVAKEQAIGNTTGNGGAITAISSTSFKFSLKNRNVITGPVHIIALG